jgi:hypothetical protein
MYTYSVPKKRVAVGQSWLLLGIAVVLLMAFGWAWNIVKLIALDFEHSVGEAMLRAIGVVIPFIGSVVGWF